ncbi:zeta toxin family protein [soil metagenome]
MSKTIEIFAGPNGSGKTTFVDNAFIKRSGMLSLNSDSIAKGISPNGNEIAQYEAGRFMLNQIKNAINTNQSFAFETTMSGRIWISYLKKARKSGYKIKIYFVFVKSIELSLKRIENRVKFGGHDIPEEIVRRRFDRTFRNFIELYAPLADEWFVIDNSENGKVIAEKNKKKKIIFDAKLFKKYFK